jgi:hypothetical protein
MASRFHFYFLSHNNYYFLSCSHMNQEHEELKPIGSSPIRGRYFVCNTYLYSQAEGAIVALDNGVTQPMKLVVHT